VIRSVDVHIPTDPGPLELVLPDHTRLALAGDLTIGRAPDSTLRLFDPSVSRKHARISLAAGGDAVLEDAGSSYGTWLDGRRIRAPSSLRPGSRIRVGDIELLVDRRPDDAEAGATIVVEPNASLTIGSGGPPRVRSGHALKRLEAAEGDRRWVLKDLRSGRFVRLSDADAELFGLLDGERSLAELMREAGERLGPSCSARLMLLLASLGERGFLAGTPAVGGAGEKRGRLGRLLTPRHLAWSGAAAWFDGLYRSGGWALLRPPALVMLGRSRGGGNGGLRLLGCGPLRDAVRRGEQARHRRPRVHARALRRGRAA
jgi:pSer/pThr/pTyr-binding forkhead associated (FHA) protein